MSDWNIQKAKHTYNIAHWGAGYFDINENGHISVHTDKLDGKPGIDLYEVAHRIQEKGLHLPVLVRFTDVLQERAAKLCSSFDKAIAEYGYDGQYTAVYPIKVNQQRTVVEHIVSYSDTRVGLEAGSKPELMVVLALANADNGVIICNGYKDREYIRLALIGRKLGHRIHIVIEKLSELDLVLEEAAKLKVEPLLGLRVRLLSIGKGKWQNTGGEKSKFGLSATQVLEVVQKLRSVGKLDTLQLIHCHLGSQIANIRDIQIGLKEVSRYFAELHALEVNIRTVDVGGGLGIDYEGTRSRSYCSMNYGIQEYAKDVVHALWEICEEKNLPHPDIITESGRALTAHHAVLITNVIDTEQVPTEITAAKPDSNSPLILQNLWASYRELSSTRSPLEAYHDAAHWMAEAQTAYNHGVFTLENRALAEQLYFAICRAVHPMLQAGTRSHREALDDLNEKLADKYFCNLSIFQSVPDVWAIEQIFPIVPLHRLNEEPVKRVTIQDLTCDSDGAIEHYVDEDSIEATLLAHQIKPGEAYMLGIFLVGAYQEILGDMHNLFGDTHSINVEIRGDGSYELVEPEQGDTVTDVLNYVHFSVAELADRYRRKISAAGLDKNGDALLAELEEGLTGYTYLED